MLHGRTTRASPPDLADRAYEGAWSVSLAYHGAYPTADHECPLHKELYGHG
jgi:hypothetical protein